jgi:hypothetical protein
VCVCVLFLVLPCAEFIPAKPTTTSFISLLCPKLMSLSSLRYDLFDIRVSKPLGPFHCELGYPIYLMQSTHARELNLEYEVSYNGKPIVPALFVKGSKGLPVRVKPIMCFGRSELCPPMVGAGDEEQLEVKEHHWVNTTAHLKVRPWIGSEGGNDNTVRIRLLLLHPTDDVVITLADTERFAIMTRTLPNEERRINMYGACSPSVPHLFRISIRVPCLGVPDCLTLTDPNWCFVPDVCVRVCDSG